MWYLQKFAKRTKNEWTFCDLSTDFCSIHCNAVNHYCLHSFTKKRTHILEKYFGQWLLRDYYFLSDYNIIICHLKDIIPSYQIIILLCAGFRRNRVRTLRLYHVQKKISEISTLHWSDFFPPTAQRKILNAISKSRLTRWTRLSGPSCIPKQPISTTTSRWSVRSDRSRLPGRTLKKICSEGSHCWMRSIQI